MGKFFFLKKKNINLSIETSFKFKSYKNPCVYNFGYTKNTYTDYTKLTISEFLNLSQNKGLHRSGRMYNGRVDNLPLTGYLSPYLYLQQDVIQTVI